MPALVKNIKLLTVVDHKPLLIAASNDVDESIFEFIVGCERCPTFVNRRQLLHRIISQMELEDVANRPILWIINIISGDNYDLLIWNVDRATESELLIETVVLHILNIFGLVRLPGLLPFGLLFKLGLGANIVEISIHDVTTCILVQLVLVFNVRTVSNGDGSHNVRHDAVVKLPG